MAINKKLIHFNKKATFNSQKLSANDSNTQYQVGGTGTVQTGAPDINYQSIVYIKDSKEIWTHGQFYATAVTWSTITGKPSFATVATSGSYNDLNNKPTIPTKLPTPNALTFTGAVTGTWDGSSAKTVNIPSGSSYTLPLASNSTRGGIKLSSSTQGGTPNGITTTSGRTYAVQVNSNEQAVVNVPWTDTTYTLPTASSSTLGGVKVGSGLSISNGVLSTGNYVSNVEAGLPSTNWQSAYVPLTISYRDGSTSMETISLPMATGDGGNGSAGLMSGADKKKLDGFSGGVPSKIENGATSVTCTGDKVVATTGDTTINMNDSNAQIELSAGAANMYLGTADLVVNTTEMHFNNSDYAYFLGRVNIGDDLTVGGEASANFILNGDMDITGISVFRDTLQVGLSGATANIQVLGQVEASYGFFDTSDARVKTNVKEIDASNADKVRLVEFDRTDKEHHGYGVIAQELEKVYPEMVNTDDEGFKSVNYNELAMVKIKYLEDKVARLEALVGRLLAE